MGSRIIIETETNSKGEEIFYVRDYPYIPGCSYNISATSREGAEWQMKRLPQWYYAE